ncbi:MAG TPA: hypothetical protein VMF67_06960 [Rhizomicrobium sp.]|nr:hypothetical protein [Rhizomicrobium sp.]
MSAEEIAFLIVVFGGLAVFGIVLGYVSWWSARPGSHAERASRTAGRISVSPAPSGMA